MSVEEMFGIVPEVENEPEIEISEEQEAAPEGEADIETEETEEAEAEEVEAKKKNSPVDRIRELSAQNREMRESHAAELQQIKWQLEQERLANQKLLGLSQAEPEEDNEVLDTVVDKKVEALREQIINQAIESELSAANAQNPKMLDAHMHLLGSLTHEMMLAAQSAGYNITQEQAYNQAKENLDGALKQIKSRNGSVANYIYQSSVMRGFQEKTSEKQENKVNMKAVKELRERAGAPAIQKQAFQPGVDSDIKAEIRKQNKEMGISEAQSAMFGL